MARIGEPSRQAYHHFSRIYQDPQQWIPEVSPQIRRARPAFFVESAHHLFITHEHLRDLLSLFCKVLASLESLKSAARLTTDTVSHLKSYNALAMPGLVYALLEQGGEELQVHRFVDDKRR